MEVLLLKEFMTSICNGGQSETGGLGGTTTADFSLVVASQVLKNDPVYRERSNQLLQNVYEVLRT